MSSNRSNGAWIAALSIGVIVFVVCVSYAIYKFMKSTVDSENSKTKYVRNPQNKKVPRTKTTLPEGWEELFDGENTAYYYHEASETTSWDHPAAKKHNRVTSKGVELPPGWERHTADDGEFYYENGEGSVQWDAP
tara:strand:- start:17 stop:421 length:405 start_codon:yes stop_codon:yes gene_type:complete